jgi:hypothetical protein
LLQLEAKAEESWLANKKKNKNFHIECSALGSPSWVRFTALKR